MSKSGKSGLRFAGFPEDSSRFLAELKANNNREWFAENKQRYETSLKQPAEAFAAALSERLEELTGAAHTSKIFRIHRDVRFSKDKTPYNAHLHIGFMPEDSASAAGWYFGMYAKKATLGAGVFALEKERLTRFRQKLHGEKGDTLREICEALLSAGFRLSEPELKRTPPPYPSDHPNAEYLRRKSLAAWFDFDNPKWLTGSHAISRCIETFQTLKPLNDWLSDLDRMHEVQPHTNKALAKK